MLLSDLPQDLTPGVPLVINCCTSDADIYYKGPAEYGRAPVRPTAYQLMEIPYTLRGVFEHYRTGVTPACIVIRSSESGKKQLVYLGGIRRILYDAESMLAGLV